MVFLWADCGHFVRTAVRKQSVASWSTSGTRISSFVAQQKSPRRGLFKFASPAPASMRVGPDLLLGKIHQSREDDQEHEHLQAEALAGLHMRFPGPRQERGDVLGILRDGSRRAIVKRDLAIAQRLRHLDGVAGEIFVVVGALGNADARRRLFLKTLQDPIDVIRALLLELREEVQDEPGEAALIGT